MFKATIHCALLIDWDHSELTHLCGTVLEFRWPQICVNKWVLFADEGDLKDFLPQDLLHDDLGIMNILDDDLREGTDSF